jgi:hypothetical protein
MSQFWWGALTASAAVVGLFFLKFWRDSHDRLFIFFALAFWTLGLHWLGLAMVNPEEETRHQLFLLRLLAFSTIIVGVLDKNTRAARAAAKDTIRDPSATQGSSTPGQR